MRVDTKRGWVVLASDAAHYYENMVMKSPFPVVYHMGDMLDGYDQMFELASSPDHLIPGHDPLVAERYPMIDINQGIVIVALDESPKTAVVDQA